MNDKKSAIEKLEYFKELLNEWEYGNPTSCLLYTSPSPRD